MADTAVESMESATTLNATDKFYLIQGGVDKQVTPATIFANIPSPMRTTKQLALGGTPQELANDGEINATTNTTFLLTDTAATVTIADGLYAGQLKFVIMSQAGGTATLSGSNVAAPSIALSEISHSIILLWTNNAWWPLAGTATITY